MLKNSERYVLTTGKASVIRDALVLVLAGVKPEGDLSPARRERIEAFARVHCDQLILDLRTAEDRPGGISPRVRNLRVRHLGQVLVVTGEAAGPEILHDIKALSRPHFSPQYLSAALLAFVHTLF